jgi:hypothetical protein
MGAMRLPRMTTRRWMLAAAVAGLSLGTYRMLKTIEDFQMDCAVQMLIHDIGQDVNSGVVKHLVGHSPQPNPRKAAYHAAMLSKWEHAYSYPWFPVEPDPPEPD